MKKVLVVEDNVDVANNIKYMLSKSGYTVLVANDGEEGVELAREHRPDFLIMDLILPGLSGAECVSAIKKNPLCRDIPVIFLTGLMSSDEENQGINTILIEGKKYPALAKPFDFKELLKAMENPA